MLHIRRSLQFIAGPVLALALSLALGACATTYTGPIEVTRFVAEEPAGLGQGDIMVAVPDEMSNDAARAAFTQAVSRELAQLGYTLVEVEGASTQVATIRTSRNLLESAGRRRGPVSVGVGGSTGSYGSGVGLGLGINLGGDRGPVTVTELSVRISDTSGQSIWEGRAEFPTNANSPYSQVDAAADALAAALFRDFPGGNGETVQVTVDQIERNP